MRVRRSEVSRKAMFAGKTKKVSQVSPTQVNSLHYAVICRQLSSWFICNARDLPWRHKPNPWKSFVSEALLQQTQVARVAERFPEFTRLFSSPRAMVKAGQSRVLQAWRGLGYYRRARSLYAAAKMIVRDHAGEVPDNMQALQALPGVGRYTAGAIASIAFGHHEPIVDGNVARVLSRLSDRRGVTNDRAGQQWCWHHAMQFVRAAKKPGVCNEALMELGATLCTPMHPKCEQCPLRLHCRSRAAGSQDVVPPPKPGAKRTRVVHHALVQIRENKVGLVLRDTGLWSGLLAVPSVETTRCITLAQVKSASGASSVRRAVARFEFLTTHRRVQFVVHSAVFPAAKRLRWVSLAALQSQAVSAATLQVVRAACKQINPTAAKLHSS